jgi:hypothetical protein
MIDINKKYRTLAGQEVRIYATDAGGQWPIHGAVKYDLYDCWLEKSWDENGDSPYEECNLVEIKPRIQQTIYLNIYDGYTSISSTEKIAEDRADCGIIARVKVDIDVEEGHGL